LSFELAALPDEFASITDFAVLDGSSFLSTIAPVFPKPIQRRLLDLDAAWKFFRQAASYEAIVTMGDLAGLAVAFLRRLGGRRQVHVMYDCLWYGGNAAKRAWMRYCLRSVDKCVVWSSIECDRYAHAYGVAPEKFVFIPHHHTIHKYSFEVADDGYIFTGGNWSRDYRLFVEAVRKIDFPGVIATNRSRELLHGVELPAHVKVVSVSAQEFRSLMARSTFVVLPLEANHLHAGGQQTIVNAMAMGKPVIVTDPEGARDYVHDGVDGFLVPFGDRQALGDAIQKLVNDPNKVRMQGRSGREFAQNLTTSACNEAIWREVLKCMAPASERHVPETGSCD
jgi:glycosyltransferase involved in cell wall biosynthesis